MSRAREFQFPYRLENLTDLPEEFRRAASHVLPPGEAPRVISMIPPGTFFDVKNEGAWQALCQEVDLWQI